MKTEDKYRVDETVFYTPHCLYQRRCWSYSTAIPTELLSHCNSDGSVLQPTKYVL